MKNRSLLSEISPQNAHKIGRFNDCFFAKFALGWKFPRIFREIGPTFREFVSENQENLTYFPQPIRSPVARMQVPLTYIFQVYFNPVIILPTESVSQTLSIWAKIHYTGTSSFFAPKAIDKRDDFKQWPAIGKNHPMCSLLRPRALTSTSGLRNEHSKSSKRLTSQTSPKKIGWWFCSSRRLRRNLLAIFARNENRRDNALNRPVGR